MASDATCGGCPSFVREHGRSHAGACMESAHQGRGHWSYHVVPDALPRGREPFCPWHGPDGDDDGTEATNA